MRRRLSQLLPIIAIVALAFNLRPAAVSVGPVLAEISADLALSPALSGLLTSIPTLCFACFGAVAPWLGLKLGPHLAIALSFAAIAAGQIARPFTDSSLVFMALSVVALAGMATGNVLIPSLVRLHYPFSHGLATALYSLSMAIGVTLASSVTVPLAMATGGWQGALVAWGIVALASLVAWLPMLRFHSRRQQRSDPGHTLAAVARTRLGWAMAVFFGMQSGTAYTMFGWMPSVFRSHGMSEVDAGFMLGVFTGVGIPLAFIVPAYVARKDDQTRPFLGFAACLVAGWIGLIVAPMWAPWLWATLLAFGGAAFPMLLALFSTRANSATATAALSGFAQSIGYLISATQPVLFGIIHGWSGGWRAPLLFMLLLAVPFTICGYYSCRPLRIEDQLC